jgi:hypothetical protein
MTPEPGERLGVAGAQRMQELTRTLLLLFEIHGKPPSRACVRMQAERGSIDRMVPTSGGRSPFRGRDAPLHAFVPLYGAS